VREKGVNRPAGLDEPMESWARRGTKRLIWAYAIAAAIAIGAAVAYKDSRYIVQVVVGLGLVAYFLFVWRAVNRRKTGSS